MKLPSRSQSTVRDVFQFLAALALVLVLAQNHAGAQDPGSQTPAVPQGPAAISTAFTYQGQLKSGSSPVTASCDMKFQLYGSASGGSPIATQLLSGVVVTDGLFTVQLNFGVNAFKGDPRWLEIAVGCPSGSPLTVLTPRQALTAAPYALYSTAAPWSGITGMPAGFADGVDNNTTYTAGAGLTLNGTQFAVVSDTVQLRVNGSCAAGRAIRAIAADGTVTCEFDNNTTYTAGAGLTLNGTQFSAEGSAYANVVVVAKSGGDFTSIQEAITSITDAGPTKRYLVWVAPGTYDLGGGSLAMSSYIDVAGAGPENTIISSTAVLDNAAFPDSPLAAATIQLASHSRLSNLRVVNQGTVATIDSPPHYSLGIVASDVSNATVENVIVDVNGVVGGSTASNHFGVYVFSSSLTLKHVESNASGANTTNAGLSVDRGQSSVTVFDSAFSGTGGTNGYGIFLTEIKTLVRTINISVDIINSVIAADGATDSVGVFSNVDAGTCTAKIHSSRIDTPGTGSSGSHPTVRNGTSGVCNINVGATHLDGGAVQQGTGSGTIKCALVYDDQYNSYVNTPSSTNNYNCPNVIG